MDLGSIPHGRRWLTVLLVAALVLVPLATYAAARTRALHDSVVADAGEHAGIMEDAWRETFEDAAENLVLFQSYWAGGGSQGSRVNLSTVIADEEGIARLVILSGNGTVLWSAPASAAGGIRPGDVDASTAGVLALAAERRVPVAGPLTVLIDGATGFRLAVSLHDEEGELDGFAVAEMPLDEVLATAEPAPDFAYLVTAGEAEIRSFGGPPAGVDAATVRLAIPSLRTTGDDLALTVTPTPDRLRDRIGSTPLLFALLAAAGSCAAGVVTWTQLARRDERVASRRKIAASERHYRGLFENAGEMILILDDAGKLVEVNPRTTATLGYGSAEITGRNLEEFVEEADREAVRSAIARSLQGAWQVRLEWTFLRRDGAPVETYGTLTASFVDARVTLQAHLADVTRLRHLEREARRANFALREKVRELDSFAHTVAHDLKNPIRVVSSFTAFLEEDEGARLSASGRHELEEIRKAADRMRNMVDAILLYARAGSGDHAFETVDAGEVLAEAVADLQALVRERGARITVQPDLPRILAQRVPLRQVFENLVANAIRHNPTDRPEVSVSARRLENDVWEFTVADNGPGIPPDRTERIFELFERGNDADASSGVGLSIAKRIVERHRGRIRAENLPEGGAAFRFTIAPVPDPLSDPGAPTALAGAAAAAR